MRFSHSQSKHRLFVGNIPKHWEKDELEKVLAEQGPGIQSVELLKVDLFDSTLGPSVSVIVSGFCVSYVIVKERSLSGEVQQCFSSLA